jgi:hypothetical protein
MSFYREMTNVEKIKQEETTSFHNINNNHKPPNALDKSLTHHIKMPIEISKYSNAPIFSP